MKKQLCLILCVLFLMAGCGSWDSVPLSGEILDYDNDQKVFLMGAYTGGAYSCYVNQDTEFVLDTNGNETILGKGTLDLCELFYIYAHVDVIVSASFEAEDDPFLEESYACCWAKRVVIHHDTFVTQVTEAKPVIYLYPEADTEVSVKLNYDGKLTCTYPKYENGWTVTAHSNGKLVDAAGQTYNYLYWEGETDAEYDFSQGFCVSGKDSAAFLEDTLAQLGLNRREANEFIVYWLPILESSPYNLVAFQTDAYTSHAELAISPAPDTLIRVFMAFQALDAPIEIEPQILPASERSGFTVVEWGGAKID